VTIEAPQAVVLRTLIDFNQYHEWCPNISKSGYNPDSRIRETTYLFGDKTVDVSEKIQMIESEKIILFSELIDKKRGYMSDVVNEIRFQENADGTTNVNWAMHYNLEPMLSKIINLFFMKPDLHSMLEENLTSLKLLIEER